jgi:hypothetical protein
MRADHRSALEWLNSSTPPGMGFFGIEIEAVRIGDSPAASRCPLCRVGGWARLAVDSRFLRHGIEPALSADATAMAPGDMFSQMRVAFACGRGE